MKKKTLIMKVLWKNGTVNNPQIKPLMPMNDGRITENAVNTNISRCGSWNESGKDQTHLYGY